MGKPFLHLFIFRNTSGDCFCICQDPKYASARHSMKTEDLKQPHSKMLVEKMSFYNWTYHKSTDNQIKLKLMFQDKKLFLTTWRSETCNFIE